MAAHGGVAESVDDRILNTDDLQEVMDAVIDVVSRWLHISLALGVRLPQVRTIQSQHPGDMEAALEEALQVWLRRAHLETKHGPPTWKKLVEAVAGKAGQNPSLAAKIASAHPAASSGPPPPPQPAPTPVRPKTPRVLSLSSVSEGETLTVGGSLSIQLVRYPAHQSSHLYTAVEYSFGTIPVGVAVEEKRMMESYIMTSPGIHGICAVINNEKFSSHAQRHGTHVDEVNLTQCFRYLGYTVEVHRNLTAHQIESVFRYYSNNIDHSKYDSFVGCVLSHGEDGHVFGTDSKTVSLSSIVNGLTAESCPSLAGKPKLFFIQACRGRERVEEDEVVSDSSVTVEPSVPPPSSRGDTTETEERVVSDSTALSIPDDADFIFGNATPPGKVAWRDMDHGSWYISETCRVFSSLAISVDLVSMVTKVHDEVGTRYRNRNYRQAPELTTRLRKKVYFFG